MALKCMEMVSSVMLLSVYILNVSATDSEHLQEMCFNHGDHPVRPHHNANITGPCAPWNPITCCTAESVSNITTQFNYDHCEHKMSEKCKSHFIRRSCFEYCSPNLGPWKKLTEKSRMYTRFQFLPLCRSQCEAWWKDCKDEITCVENWTIDFQWSDGYNYCPKRSTCEKVSTKYKDSTYFCEHVTGPYDFIVVNDDDHCMTLFDEMHDNKYVTIVFADKIEKSGNDELYDHAYILQEKHNYTEKDENFIEKTPEMKFLVLSFFVGVIVTILILVLTCFVYLRCRTKMRRSVSSLFLVSNPPNEENETEVT